MYLMKGYVGKTVTLNTDKMVGLLIYANQYIEESMIFKTFGLKAKKIIINSQRNIVRIGLNWIQMKIVQPQHSLHINRI